MDLGSGCGVPGLLMGLISAGDWILAESERSKGEFLRTTASSLGAKNVRVASERGETVLQGTQVRSIVARAVGPVDRIYSWIRNCSTWNNLVLLKGPGWAAEWERLNSGAFKGELLLEKKWDYTVGHENKQRTIVRLARKKVPRGTTPSKK